MVKACVALTLLSGCSYIFDSFNTNDFSGDPFPILTENVSGAMIVGLHESDTTEERVAVLDVLSPLTLIDRGAGIAPRIDERDVTIEGVRAQTGELDLPRATIHGHEVVTLHPCLGDTCQVGTGIGPRDFNALVGMDAFGSDALRLHLATNEIYILPDVAGSEIHRSRSCDAVLPGPFRGGGTLVLGGTEIPFANWRIAMDVCLDPNPDPLLVQSARGVDALLVLSTALGTSILNETTYAKLRVLDPGAPPLELLPMSTVFLPSGPVEGRLTLVHGLALVGNSSSDPRAPCRQMYAHHFLAKRDCEGGDTDCPCIGETFCAVPALVTIAPPTYVSVLIVPDDNATLQALRAELRPDRPEVDGILGTEALQTLELDIDYAHDRLLARCVDRGGCQARPELDAPAARAYVNGCNNE